MWVIGTSSRVPGAADLLGRGHDGLGAAQHLPHGIAARIVPQRGVFEFTAASDDAALAVALHQGRISAEGREQLARHGQAQRLQVVHKSLDVLDVAAGEGIGDDGDNSGAARGRIPRRAAIMKDLLYLQHQLAQQDLGHSPLPTR